MLTVTVIVSLQEGPEVWPLLGLAAQLWPSRLSLRRPGHLGACWRLRASGPAWGNPKAAGGRQERPAHHGLQSSVGQKSVLPPTPASDQFITCAVPHLPASPSPLCLARLLSGHLTMQPQFPQVRMRIKMPTSGIHIQGGHG